MNEEQVEELIEEGNREQLRDRYEKRIWTTKKGKCIKVKEMTDSHLEKTIKMLEERERRAKYRHDEINGIPTKDWKKWLIIERQYRWFE